MQRNGTLNTVSILLMAAVTCGAQESTTPKQITEEDAPFLLTYPNLENSNGEVVLTNEHVVLQRLVVGAGEWEGIHSHPGNQIYVHIIGGEWSWPPRRRIRVLGKREPERRGWAGWTRYRSAPDMNPATPAIRPSI